MYKKCIIRHFCVAFFLTLSWPASSLLFEPLDTLTSLYYSRTYQLFFPYRHTLLTCVNPERLLRLAQAIRDLDHLQVNDEESKRILIINTNQWDAFYIGIRSIQIPRAVKQRVIVIRNKIVKKTHEFLEARWKTYLLRHIAKYNENLAETLISPFFQPLIE